jgi:hypothetical protein
MFCELAIVALSEAIDPLRVVARRFIDEKAPIDSVSLITPE